MTDFDIVVAGAGAVGLAAAIKLSQSGRTVLVLEKHPSFGNETSSRNSEVIHAGIYYPKDSLKAKLCVEGKKLLYEWCNNNNVPYKKKGKYIIASDENEKFRLDELYLKAIENGVDDIRFADKEEVTENNPGINCISALFSPSTGIIDSHLLMESFIENGKKAGCEYVYNHKVIKIEKEDNFYKISINNNGDEFIVTSEYFINAAGLGADLLAESSGINIDNAGYRIHFCKGHYFKLQAGLNHIANNLIYPVPPVNHAGLGVHITMDINGNLKLGPDVLYMDERIQDYNVPEPLLEKFYESARKFIPDLQPEDLSPDYAGIRPKLQGRGEPFRDFIIHEESDKGFPNFINLIGIESPGLTSSLAIANYIKDNFFQY